MIALQGFVVYNRLMDNKPKERVKDDLIFKEVLKLILTQYNFEDLRVTIQDGLISFQGTARKLDGTIYNK